MTARWGLVPFFANDEKTGYKCINACAETVATSPTFAVITTTPNELTQRLHDRMPVILEVGDYRTWLDGDDPRELLRPRPVDVLGCYPVSSRVNTPKNNAPDLIAPAR